MAPSLIKEIRKKSMMKKLYVVLLCLFLTGCASMRLHPVDYNDYVRQKITKVSYQHLNAYNEEGKVLLVFKLNNRGELLEMKVDDENSKASPEIKELALKVLKESAPFKSFPAKYRKYPELEYKVLLSFEIRK